MTIERTVVVVPAHDEYRPLPRALRAIRVAANRASTPVVTVVVLDACSDESAYLAGEYGGDVHFIEVDRRNVGAARAAGFVHARTICAADAVDESRTWYATTDADSRVDADWLVRQQEAAADMVLGVVRVTNWHGYPAAAIARYLLAYQAKSRFGATDHGHVHGANMGFRADLYWGLGGFAALESDEDVDLARRFEEAGHRIHRDGGLSVETSARREGRAPRGFAHHLRVESSRGGAA